MANTPTQIAPSIDLSKFDGCRVRVKQRNGVVHYGVVIVEGSAKENAYPIEFNGYSYTNDGHYFGDSDDNLDIVEASLAEQPPEPPKTSEVPFSELVASKKELEAKLTEVNAIINQRLEALGNILN